MSLNLRLIETKVGKRRRALINLTKHTIKFTVDGREIVLSPPCGLNLDAQKINSLYGTMDDIRLTRTTFMPQQSKEELITQIQKEYPGAVLIGATLQYQAYSRIWGMVPFLPNPSGETVRLMRLDEFNVSAGRCPACGHWAEEKYQAIPS